MSEDINVTLGGQIIEVKVGEDSQRAFEAVQHISILNDNVKIGENALDSYASTEAIGIGLGALFNATGIRNIGIGAAAGAGITSGSTNLIIGWGAQASANVSASIVIGYEAEASNSGQIVLGTATQDHFSLFGVNVAHWHAATFNLWLGDYGASIVGLTGSFNLGLGRQTTAGITTGSANLGIGTGALEVQATGNNAIGIGVTCLQSATAVADCTYVGVKGARYMIDGTGGTGFGFRTQEHGRNARNNTTIGDSTLWHSQGQGNVIGGYVAAEGMALGDFNIAFGIGAMRYRQNGDNNIFLGRLAGAITSNAGAMNLVDTAIWSEDIFGADAGHENIGIGTKALEEFLGSGVVAVGHQAGIKMVGTAATSYNSTFLGHNAGQNASQKTDASNSMALGAGSFTTADNQITLGNSSISALRCAVTTITAISDRRQKEDHGYLAAGLDFIRDVKVHDFTWNERSGREGQREAGVFAQELHALAAKHGLDWMGLAFRPEHPEKEPWEASPGKLLFPLINAVKELAEQNAALVARLEALEAA